MVGLQAVSPGVVTTFSSHIYQRLPHPLSNILNEIPMVDGTNVNLVCEFLLTARKLRQLSQLPDQLILELTYLYCWDNLLALLSGQTQL